jgi:tRNA (cytidine/uridine-2'-O-)-methyltransferase
MFHIVLIEPEIPHNAGAAGRLALATDSTLHLVERLGFSLDDKYVRRTGVV